MIVVLGSVFWLESIVVLCFDVFFFVCIGINLFVFVLVFFLWCISCVVSIIIIYNEVIFFIVVFFGFEK